MKSSVISADTPESARAMQLSHPAFTGTKLRVALDSVMRESLRPIAAGLSTLYAFFALSHALLLPEPAATTMTSVALGTSGVLLGVNVALRRWLVPLRWAHPVGACIAGFVLLNSLLHLYLIPEPQQSTNIALLMIGVGCFFLSARWLALVLGLSLGGWLALALIEAHATSWRHYGFMLIISMTLSVLIYTVRSRAYRRLEMMRLRDERRTEELEQELTGRRRAEEALVESEYRYRDLVEHSLGLICAHDLDGYLLSVNPAAAHTLGREPAEMVGKKLVEFLAPSTRHLFEDYLKRIQQQPADSGLMRVVTKEGEERLWSYRNLRYEEEGKFPYVLGHAQDITERRQVEETLRNSSKRITNILESITDGFFALDREWRFTYINRRAEQILRRERGDLLGKNVCEEFSREVGSIFYEQYRRAMVEGVMVEFEAFYPPFDLWAEIRAYPSAEGLAVYFRDTTERKKAEVELQESERRFRQLAENIREVFWIADPHKHEILYISPTYAEVWGQSCESLYEQPNSFLKAVHPEDYGRVLSALEKHVQGESTDQEYRIILPNGSIRWIRDRAFPVKDEAGKVCRVAGIADNITEQKQAQEALHTFSRRLMEAQEAERRRIARELHDQIGQALIAVEINLQAAKLSSAGSPSAPQLDEGIRIVDAALQQVRTLSHDLRPSLLDDLGLVAALRWYMDQQARRAGLTAEFVAEPLETRLSPEVETACFRIAQEALTNAVRHARAAHVWVKLKQCKTELHLFIRDDGIGFDARAVRKRYAYGAGLGLQGMQERALGIGGVIEIKSRPSHGTEVRARLPLRMFTAKSEEPKELSSH